jgi:hypothetical protein
MTATPDDYCPACGYRKPPDAESCPDCGERFTTPSGAPPPAEVREKPAAPAEVLEKPAAPAPQRLTAWILKPPSPPPSPTTGLGGAPSAAPPQPSAVAAPPAVSASPSPPVAGPPRAVPLASSPPLPEDEAPPGYATVWPPVTAVGRAAPPPESAAPPPAAAEPADPPPPAPLPAAAPLPLAEPPPDMAPISPPAAPQPRGPADRRLLAIGGVVLAIMIAGLALLFIPHGAKAPARHPVAPATPTPTATKALRPALAAQVNALDRLMRMSERGRSAAVNGNFAAAVANRASLLAKIERLRARATAPALRAGLASFAAAVREALQQNRTCRAACSAADLARVGRLKRAALGRLNPLLRRYAGTSYRPEQI